MLTSKKFWLAVTSVLLIMILVAGCGGNQGAQGSAETHQQEETTGKTGDNTAAQPSDKESQSGEPGNKEAEQTADVRVIEHAMGKTEIEGTPERIVTLYQGATDVAVALGVKPVGMVESWVEKPIYQYLRDDVEGVPIVGLETQPNLEEIAKLDPDLIIASKVRHEKIYEQLSQIAPTVTHETVYKFKETVELMGKAMNKQEEADELLAAWDRRVADFKGKIFDDLSGHGSPD